VSASLDVTVIVPAHNEGPNLQVLLPQLRTILDGLGIETEVMVVVRDPDAQTRDAVGGGRGTIVQQREPGYGGALRRGGPAGCTKGQLVAEVAGRGGSLEATRSLLGGGLILEFRKAGEPTGPLHGSARAAGVA
jgi:hypothetical protein